MINIYRMSILPFNAIDDEVHLLLDSIDCLETDKSSLKRCLECVLQLTNNSLDTRVLNSPEFEDICHIFIGALYTEGLFQLSLARKFVVANTFLKIIRELNSLKAAHFTKFPVICFNKLSADVNRCVEKFRDIDLDEEMFWLWRGWRCENKSGVVHWPSLYPLYIKFGKSFTEKFHASCSDYFRTRKISLIYGLKSFTEFIDQYTTPISIEDFKNPSFMKIFWKDFLVFYIKNEHAKGVKLHRISSRWRTCFKTLVTGYLIPSGLFVETYGEFPSPPIIQRKTITTNVKVLENGHTVNEKLITRIPLQVTDEEAMQILFERIEKDIQIATKWAEWAVADIWNRYLRRKALSSEGQVIPLKVYNGKTNKKWMRSTENPDRLKNAAATLAFHNGYTDKKTIGNLLAATLATTAFDLGLPISGSLLPHCTLLVANHPAITQSFLENLELYDTNGKLVGFIEGDGVARLVGYKERKGSKLAEQKIVLNKTTVQVIRQIIDLTSDIRAYLKSKNDDNWRYLLLTCGHAFGYPKRWSRISSYTSDKKLTVKFEDSLSKVNSLTEEETQNFINSFSLTGLRASCGVLIYIKTRSIKEMSLALGHTQIDRELIKAYLPESILSFFQNRWIRIFQSAILFEALKDSPYIHEASGFKTIHEIDTFLANHALKLPTDDTNSISSKTQMHRLVFGVNTQILQLLLSVKISVENAKESVHYKAKYWAEIINHLFDYIEAHSSFRPDLKHALDQAKLNCDPKGMEKLIYA